VQRIEQSQVVDDLRAGKDTIDSRVLECSQQAIEHRSSVRHRQRVVVEADHRPGSVVGSHDEQHSVLRQRVASPPRRKRLGNLVRGADTSFGQRGNVLSSSDTVILQRLFDLVQRRHRVAAQQPRRHDRSGDVAVLDDPYGLPTRQQPVNEHAAEGVAGAETTDDLDEVWRHDRGALRRRHHHALATHLDDGQLHSPGQQSTRRLGGIA
jgi:hypothetical protein